MSKTNKSGAKPSGSPEKVLARAVRRLTGKRVTRGPMSPEEKAAVSKRLEKYKFKKGEKRASVLGAKGGAQNSNRNIAEQIAIAVLEADPNAAIRAFTKKLKAGDKFVFDSMADRAFGKPKQDIGLVGDPLLQLLDEFKGEAQRLEDETSSE